MTTSALRTKISLCKFAPAARVTGGRGVLLALGGALLGVINGLFGAGGGMVAVPVINFLFYGLMLFAGLKMML